MARRSPPTRPSRRVPAALRHPAAILLIVVAGIVPWRAWSGGDVEPAEIDQTADGLSSITWTGTLAADGRLAVRVHYELVEGPRTFDIRVPPGAQYLALDGTPIAASIGRYATAEIDGPATITYELPGRTARYRDGVLVTIAGATGDFDSPYDTPLTPVPDDELVLNGDLSLFSCPRCFLDPIGYGDAPLFGGLYATGASGATLWFNGLQGAQIVEPEDADLGDPGEAGDDAIFFLGANEGAEEVSMIAVLPVDAAPDVERSDGDVGSALDGFRSRFTDDDDEFAAAAGISDSPDRTIAVVLTALFVVLVGCLAAGWWIAGADRRRRNAGPSPTDPDLPDGAPTSTGETPRLSGSGKPGDLEPALAGLVVDDTTSADRSPVAATILELVRRDVISIEGTDNRRFAITIPPGAKGSTPFEQAVLTQMRPNGVEPSPAKESVLTGPPLWHGRAPVATAVLRRALVRAALKAGLIRRNVLLLAAPPLVFAIGFIAVFVADLDVTGLTFSGWLAMVLGPLAGLAVVHRAGATLTAKGREERAKWSQYADWLQGDRDLLHADAPDIEILGETLVYGTALGAAPRTARALSTDSAALR